MMRLHSMVQKLQRSPCAVRYISMDVIEKAVGRKAANEFIQSMELNSKAIVRGSDIHWYIYQIRKVVTFVVQYS